MKAVPPVRLALFLLCPLVAWPGLGYDALRLPFACAAAGLLALGPRRRPGLPFAALAAFVLVPLLHLRGEGFPSFLAAATGLAAYAAARDCADRRAVPWILPALGVALGISAAFGREGFEGNSNYAGVVAGMLVPATAALAGGEGGRLRRAAFVGLAGAFFALVSSESRAGLLAAVAGLAVVAWVLAKRSGRRAAALPVVAILTIVAVPLLFRTARFVSQERMATASVRLEIWRSAWALAMDHPGSGAGLGGFAIEFPPYRSPKEAAIAYRDARPGEYREVEDAHSTPIHVLAESGVPGLLLLLLAAGLAARAVFRGALAGPLEAGLAGMAVAFSVAALFNTLHTHVSPWVLAWAAVGLIEGPAPESRGAGGAADFAPAALLAAAFACLPWVASGRALIEAPKLADPEERLRRLDGIAGWRADYQRGAAFLASGRFAEAADRFARVTLERPNHGGAWVNHAIARLRAGAPRAEAEALLLKAKGADPTYYAVEYNLGSLLMLDARPAEARERFRAAQALHPRHAGSAYGEGAAWLAEGKVEEAAPSIRRARELGMDVDAALRADFPALSADPRLR